MFQVKTRRTGQDKMCILQFLHLLKHPHANITIRSLYFFVEIMFVTYRPRLGQEEATEGLGTGNDDLNYLITHHVGLVVSRSSVNAAWVCHHPPDICILMDIL